METKSSAFNLMFGTEGLTYQVVSINSTEKVINALKEMGIEENINLQLIKITDENEVIVSLSFQQITLTPKLLNAIKVVEAKNLQHHNCGNCGHGCGR
jgi:Fe2+ transport system protein FeoA